MKKILLCISLVLILTACSKKTVNNVSVNQIISSIEQEFPIDKAIKEDLTQQEIAERYGISPSDIEEGIIYSTQDTNKADEIIILKAKEKDNIESLERAISAEIVGLSDSWKGIESEAKKIEEHISKTKDTYIIFCVSENAEEIIKLVDNILDTE